MIIPSYLLWLDQTLPHQASAELVKAFMFGFSIPYLYSQFHSNSLVGLILTEPQWQQEAI